MLTFLDSMLGFLAPHLCLGCGVEGSLLCGSCRPLLPAAQPRCYRCHRTDGGALTCKNCRRTSPLRQVWVRTTYDGVGEHVVQQLKFERVIASADTIAASIAEELYLPQDAVLVPVPTATSRVRQRGYDQAVTIAEALAKHTRLPCSRILVRHGQQRQTGSTRTQRIAQLDGAFQVRGKRLRNIKSVVLVDDVLTTGATLETAAKVMRRAGVRQVSAVAFARAE